MAIGKEEPKDLRCKDEVTRDEHQTNLLHGIFQELQKLNKSIKELTPNKKGR